MQAVVLDTNALLLPFTEGTRIEEGLESLFGAVTLHVPSSVAAELRRLARGRGAAAQAARAALRYAGRLPAEPTRLTGDDGLLEVARRLGAAVLTNDRTLQAECARSGLQVVVARERGRLALRGAGSS